MLERFFLAAALAVALSPAAVASETIDLRQFEKLEGFVDLYWDDASGTVYMELEHLDAPFLYQASLARGVGSNDLGLDRGQLGDTKVVRFIKSGPKILLVEDNLAYRATSQNQDERDAVAESFARSVVWGFENLSPSDSPIVVDATAFFVRDALGIAPRLAADGEGSYNLDASRSALFMDRTKAFPDNTEAEALVTLVGEPTGQYLPTVVPDARALSIHVHHSFIRLPDDGYDPLPYDTRSGIIGLRYDTGGYADYAVPIGEDIVTDFGRRHRLVKKDPSAAVSEAVEPIVYYLDRGAPEPVRSALLDGARWWNQAFEAAGYKDAFQVEMLPQGADPLDVRYNVIQWVHRSTRGWSYGSSVLDPRTGEILKGHVSLGSLRVRQDYLIAEGLLGPYADDEVPSEMLEMSLARIRQLSAHEVGHTIGFEHNFAASTQDRASVMDYPVPLIRIRDDDSFDLSDAYDDKIGAWDIRTVLYAYQHFPDGQDASMERRRILEQTIADGYKYVADSDSRSVATAHPDGNLWDNGAEAIAELEHLLRVRGIALENFSQRNIRVGRPWAEIEEVLVPIYLLHRYQIEAVAKLIGGKNFTYGHRGDNQAMPANVPEKRQRAAIEALLGTLEPSALRLPDTIASSIPPRPPNNPRTRETFAASTGIVFDEVAPAASATALTVRALLDPARATRMTRAGTPGFAELIERLVANTWRARQAGATTGLIQRQTNMQVLYALLGLAFNESADSEVRAVALAAVSDLDAWLQNQSPKSSSWRSHFAFANFEIERLRHDPSRIGSHVPVTVPPGSPIGSSPR